MNIIKLAFKLVSKVEKFKSRARQYYYLVMLFGYRCPKCNGSLAMIAESRCRCTNCHYEFDPTVAFERCSNCGSSAVLNIRRYSCKKCGGDINSRFLFDGIVFDSDYYRRKMIESRQRKKQLKKRVQKMLAECRSDAALLQAADLTEVPDLVEALNGLTCGIDTKLLLQLKNQFDLGKYQQHIIKQLDEVPTDIRDIRELIKNRRRDLIYRFVAIIFLAHEGKVDIDQEDQKLWVKRHANQQGQNISGKIEGTDRFERPVGTATSW